MNDNSAIIEFGSVSIRMPPDCPQPEVFKAAFFKELAYHFESHHQAARALAEWRNIQRVPEPFASNKEASYIYRRACLTQNADASRWESFQECFYEAFFPWGSDGDKQEPILPGWRPGSDLFSGE